MKSKLNLSPLKFEPPLKNSGLTIIGIDPGTSKQQPGGAAVLRDKKIISYFEWNGDDVAAAEFLREYTENSLAIIENVRSSPQQGVVSAFTFGENRGVWIGTVNGLGIKKKMVMPRVWQRAMFEGEENLRERKSFTVNFVNKLFKDLNLLKKQHGIADAVCMALYGYLTLEKND